MPGDLHNHSTCSDGSVPIHRLPLMAARAGLDTMAISDHDTLLSVNYCYEHPVQDGVRLLPATELTGYDHEHKHRVHLLCYFPDPESRELKEHCDILRQRRNECGLQSAKEIEALYPQFRTEQALEYAKDSGVLFKSGIMEALHQLGLCDAVYGKLYSYLFGWEPRGVVLHQVKVSLGAGSDRHGESCRCGAGICTPDRLQEHAAGASAGQRGHHRRH